MSERIERAAGGLVVRQGRQGREVLMIDDAYGKVAFPKGHLEPGETWEEAAVREIFEETGVRARIIGDIGRIEYRIERNGSPVRKQVRLYLLEAEGDDSPVHQVEEVNAAYFLPWDEAKTRHDERGYANWSFAFAKAEAVLHWRDGGFEEKFRKLPLAAPMSDVDAVFAKARPTLAQLVAACRDELRHTLPQVQGFPAARFLCLAQSLTVKLCELPSKARCCVRRPARSTCKICARKRSAANGQPCVSPHAMWRWQSGSSAMRRCACAR
ncbi:hypothetical protein GCM10025858_06500 [Alicyclobacillus sacchari]|uniref:NUDIX hydrolase n=1 Tax=Alicyclobacillus sacchari TaxID=392010 RepID=UPI0023E9711E|nr:NUDIX hydrolase [Alicyclobacillus sacchari]GMA56147.1 hypothetical protein GCM10025858_06500 [Alicyclobacillus sacchari]